MTNKNLPLNLVSPSVPPASEVALLISYLSETAYADLLVVDPKEYHVAKDSGTELYQVKEGLATLGESIDAHEPNRLAFSGKNASTWFYRYIEGKPITHSQASSHNNDRRSLQGLELDWDYKGLDYFLLSNTHRHWDREVWVEFWDRCRNDVVQYRG